MEGFTFLSFFGRELLRVLYLHVVLWLDAGPIAVMREGVEIETIAIA